MPLRPLTGDVVVIPIEDPDVTPGGIIVAQAQKKNVDQGVVIWIGPGVADLKPGDHVMFNSYSGDKVAVLGEADYIVIPEEYCIAVYHPMEPDGIFTLSTVRRLITARLSELHHEGRSPPTAEDALNSLLERLESLVTAEGWEF